MSCPEVMYQYYPYITYQRAPPPHSHGAPHHPASVAHAAAAAAAASSAAAVANPHHTPAAHHGPHHSHSPARPAPFQPFSTSAAPAHPQYDRRVLESTGLELCGTPTAAATATATATSAPPTGVVPQGQSSSAGSIGSAPSPASPRPAGPQQQQQQQQQHRPPLTTSAQSSRNLDDDRSTDAVGPNTATDDSDDSESRAQYVSANCVVFTHYRGDAATEVEEHFQRALAQDKPKDNINPMISRNFPASFWKSHHDVYDYPHDPWHQHYSQYHPRVHEYHHHNMAASYNSLLLNRGLSHHPGSHHPTAMAAAAHHSAAATYKDWTTAAAAGAPTAQSLVDASSAPPYPHHGPYAPLPSDYWT